MPHADFVHLRVRSAFSLLESTVRYKDLLGRCREEGMPAVAVTDSANLFGAMQFGEAAKKAGVQPILGCALPLAPPESVARQAGRSLALAPEPIVLLVKDATGWRNLMALVSAAHLEGTDGRVEIRLEQLADRAEGLVALTGGPEGPLAAALARGELDQAARLLDRLAAAFGDRLYVELQRHGLPEEERIEDALVELAYAKGLPLVATNDVRFMKAEDHAAHAVLLAIAAGRTVHEEDRPRATLEHRFKSAAEMRALFADLPEACDNTLVVARRCAFVAPARKPILPTFAVDEAAELRRLAALGLERRLAQAVWKPEDDAAAREAKARPYRERLAFECDVIVQMKFPGYFLIVSDFIRWAKSQGIPVGPGRGSGAGSLVAWALEITDLDPLRFGLLFERFLNPERVSMPDFDIDFCEERRDEVIAYVRDRYGADRVAQIITFGTLQARAALRDVGRALGLPFGLVDRICKLVPVNPANPISLAQALELEPRLGQAMAEDPQVAKMVEIALALEGLPRHASTHAAGVVIGDRPLVELVPLYRDPRASMPATQFNMKDVEKAGLVKFDFLGLSTLTLLARAERMVARAMGRPFSLRDLPLDDPATYALLGRGETLGVFQLESGGMRDALRKLKPDRFEDIVAMNALYRPGPMANIPRYIAVKHGEEAPDYLHPLLEPILAETNGVIVYQEQVMEIAKRLAGYSLGGADLLRRAMGKKIKAEMDAQRSTFVQGAVRNGIAPELAETIFEAVSKFASYGFNKSHAVAYALLAYYTAWLKANFPAEFYASAMTTEIAAQEKLAAFRAEMLQRGIALLPPDVDRSDALFTVERSAQGPAVRFALAAIKGVGEQAMRALVEARARGGRFASLFDLVDRVGTKVLNKRLLEALVQAGALDSLDPNRRRLLEAIEPALRWAQAAAEARASGQASLFGGGDALLPPTPPLPEVPDWPVLERLQREFQVLGFYLSAHPLDAFKSALDRLGVVPAASLPEAVPEGGRGRVLLAGVPIARQERAGERGRYAFAQFSDPSGQFEVTLFAEVLASSRELLDAHSPVLIEADARLEEGALRITANRLEPLADRLANQPQGIVEVRLASTAPLLELRALLAENERGARVRLVLPAEAEEVILALPPSWTLPYARRPDLAHLPGVVEIRELAVH
ncbi:MAG: DNA polymerase III subunit alpha [Geminicoccaceae bacterium]|nr:DNA polymerase III subunit alpha [Geminicoccaceae bacterium]MDW8370819.1 DNA polymerase III subunit alpha [Geminicoccaceae bacterium]